MRLLICTQVVDQNDPVLGFFHRWVEEFARHCEQISIICLRAGDFALPPNVRVYSLGKEQGIPRLLRWFKALWYVVILRRQYDAVFVHMNPEYVLLGGWFWRFTGTRVVLWYMHKSVDLKLRLAVWFAHAVATASRESFRLRTDKLHVLGHGIDPVFFSVDRTSSHGVYRILTAGRITRAKGLLPMLEALDVLYAQNVPFRFTIVGGPVTPADQVYEKTVRDEINSKPYSKEVVYMGPVPHRDLPGLLAKTDVFLNLSETGSLDKAVLEAMAAGVASVTSNEAFVPLIPGEFIVSSSDPVVIANGLLAARNADVISLRAIVARDHSLATLIPRICAVVDPSHHARS